MGIQSSILQGISLAGLLASQTPKAAEQREKHMEKVRLKQAQRKMDVYNYQMGEEGKIPETAAEVEGQLEIAQYGERAAREMFELDPSSETYRQFELSAGDVAELREQKQGLHESEAHKRRLAREKAEESARVAAEDEARLQEMTRQIVSTIREPITPKTPSLTPEEKQAILKRKTGGNP